MTDQIHVAAAVIRNEANQVFISLRPDHVHQGGLWEFPGGKVETGESVYDALVREIHEENGIDIKSAQPLIKIPFRYPDKHVLLDVWEVLEFSGTAHGKEGQECRWTDIDELNQFTFPPVISSSFTVRSKIVISSATSSSHNSNGSGVINSGSAFTTNSKDVML